MHKTNEDTASVRELVRRAARFNRLIGHYREHYLNDNFNYAVLLNNGYGVIVSKTLAHDFSRQPAIVTEDDLRRIAASVWRIE